MAVVSCLNFFWHVISWLAQDSSSLVKSYLVENRKTQYHRVFLGPMSKSIYFPNMGHIPRKDLRDAATTHNPGYPLQNWPSHTVMNAKPEKMPNTKPRTPNPNFDPQRLTANHPPTPKINSFNPEHKTPKKDIEKCNSWAQPLWTLGFTWEFLLISCQLVMW